MSIKDKLAEKTKGLGETAAPELVKTEGGPPRPRTGPGQMLAVRHLMGESQAEVAELREKLEAYAGTVPARAVDPELVGISRYANRHEDEYKTKEFIALKEEIARAGRNVQPIMVRAVKGRGKVVFEVIYGHRRLRACADLGIAVWIIVVEASDEELFLAMDMENRQRKNPSPFELGDSYRRALEEGLFSSLRNLATKLHIDVGNASKAYAIAKLPNEILDAFPSPTLIQYRWGKELSEALQKDPEGVVERAKKLKKEGRALTAPQVLAQLVGRIHGRTTVPLRLKPEDKPVGKIVHDGRGGVTVVLASGSISAAKMAEFEQVVLKFLRK